MLIEWFLSIKSLPNLLFGVLCLPGDQSHPFAQPTIYPLACCICWAGLLGLAVFPPWNEGPNFGSYRLSVVQGSALVLCVNSQLCAHICVILMLPEVSSTKISTQPKLTHSHTCFNSGGNEETM